MAGKQSNQRPRADDQRHLAEVCRKANAGDTAAVDELRLFLRDNPQVWDRIGDMAAVAEHAWISLIAGGDRLTEEATKTKLAKLREDLLDGHESAIESMLAETVVATWLELHYLRQKDASPDERSTGVVSMLMKRLESAQRRHHAALKQLVQIRQLLPGRGLIARIDVYAGHSNDAPTPIAEPSSRANQAAIDSKAYAPTLGAVSKTSDTNERSSTYR